MERYSTPGRIGSFEVQWCCSRSACTFLRYVHGSFSDARHYPAMPDLRDRPYSLRVCFLPISLRSAHTTPARDFRGFRLKAVRVRPSRDIVNGVPTGKLAG